MVLLEATLQPTRIQPSVIIKLARNRNKVGANTTSVYPCRSCEIPRAHVRANTEKMRDCHLVARTCDNEVGVAISIRDPYYIAVHEPVQMTRLLSSTGPLSMQ